MVALQSSSIVRYKRLQLICSSATELQVALLQRSGGNAICMCCSSFEVRMKI